MMARRNKKGKTSVAAPPTMLRPPMRVLPASSLHVEPPPEPASNFEHRLNCDVTYNIDGLADQIVPNGTPIQVVSNDGRDALVRTQQGQLLRVSSSTIERNS
jgi:hypothetical protein